MDICAMKTKNILHSVSYLCGLSLLCMLGASCEDYTEHNFGTPEELYQAQQVNSFTFELTPQQYQDIASNVDNKALAALDETGVTSQHLQWVGENGCFVGNISPQEYLPALLKNLVGTSQYYSLTDGSSITVQYRQGEIVNDDAFVPNTGELTEEGKYLLVPIGMEQSIAHSGEGKAYGYLLLAGSKPDLVPDLVDRVDEQTIRADAVADGYTYSFEKDEDEWLIANPFEQYLYMKGTYASFNYIDDLGDLEDEQWPNWTVTYKQADQTYDITNTGTMKTMRFTTQYNNVGAYDLSTMESTEGYLGLQIYKRVEGAIEGVEVSDELQEITFTLEDGEWQAKGDYLNMELLGGNSLTDMDAVYQATGWSVEYKGSIGDLTYVWRYDSQYGLRASAFKSSTYYPTDAWAISPAMNLKKAVKPIFTFEQAQKYAGSPVQDYLQVWVSTDFAGRGGLESATWTNVTDLVEGTWPDGSDWTYYPMSIDMSQFAGNKNVCVAFRYISTDAVAATWEVKNVVCREAEEE